MRWWICLVKFFFCPFILLWQSFWIYVGGCFGVYVTRTVRGLCCGLCVCCKFTFKDKAFPANPKSIGVWKGKTDQQIADEVLWKRIQDVCSSPSKGGIKLFSGSIEPADICQGQLGDCWLLSALACLAKHEGAIQRCFLTDEYNTFGRYRIRLWDQPKQRWRVIVVDDWIPCDRRTGKPLFAQPNADEAWVLLLEKAVAKFKGSYASLDGGSTLWALELLTGDVVYKFKYDEKLNGWKRYHLVHVPGPNAMVSGVALREAGETLSPDLMYEAMLGWRRSRSVMSASSGAGNDTQNIGGIVQGHAYSVVGVKNVENFRLLQLRNPWGNFEWQGAWSDASPLWKQYPKVARAVGFVSAEDGTFWMEWKDFCVRYKQLDVCCRSTGWSDLVLDVHEEVGCGCGPSWGCVEGCFTFWFLCRGMRALFWGSRSRDYGAVKPKGNAQVGAQC